jgi:hypothetical protein
MRDLAVERLLPALPPGPVVTGPTFDGSADLNADADLVAGGVLVDFKAGQGGRARMDGTRGRRVGVPTCARRWPATRSTWLPCGRSSPTCYGSSCLPTGTRAGDLPADREPLAEQSGCAEDGGVLGSPEDVRAARRLAGQAVDQVGRAPDRERWRALLRRVSRGRLGRSAPGWPVVPVLRTSWQDTSSGERAGWRQRAAYVLPDAVGLDDEEFADRVGLVFTVDYRVCRRCRLGWVQYPWTAPCYERCGVAAAGLAALRGDHPGVAWHTLGGHYPSSQPFWAAVAPASLAVTSSGRCART